MKKTLLSGFSIFCLLFAVVAWAAPAGQIQNASGDVKLIAKGAPAKSASSGSAVEPGTMVQTGEGGRAVIRFADGQVVALTSNSAFRLDDYQFDLATPEKGSFVASFLKGAARFVTGLIGDRNRNGWRVDTPLATAGIRGTDFLLGIQQALYGQVNSGAIGLTNSAGTVVFEAGQSLVVDSATALGTSIPAGEIPGGVFGDLGTISLSGSGGAAAGAGAGGAGGLTLPAAAGIAVGVGAAAGLALSGGGSSTTTHH